MDKSREAVRTTKEQQDRNKLMVWMKTHKKVIWGTGTVVTIAFALYLVFKDEERLDDFCAGLKDTIKTGSYLSDRWRENVPVEELHEARSFIHDEYLNPDSDSEYKEQCWKAIELLDNSIRKRERNGRECGFPVFSENGLYLLSDD